MVGISSSVLAVYYIALKSVVQCPRGSISTSYRTVGVTYLELSYSCIDNQLVVLKDIPFLSDRKPLSGSGGGGGGVGGGGGGGGGEEEEEEEEEERRKYERSGGE